jgi:glycosyltransferase 2 family protein
MRDWLRKWWWLLKAIVVLAILAAIARAAVRDLRRPEVWQLELHPAWLVLCAAFYLAGLGCSALYWFTLLTDLGQHPAFPKAIRAHYIGQMGKYLPGKAWALFLRSNIVRGPDCRVGVAVITSFYEVFITMAVGALMATVLFGVQTLENGGHSETRFVERIWDVFVGKEAGMSPVDPKTLALGALILFSAIAIPSLPPVFHRLVQRIAIPFRDVDAGPVPTPHLRSMLKGLLITPGCWFLMGASVWTALQATNLAPPWGGEAWLRYTAFIALAYVAGFVIIWMPSGLGVREAVLVLLLVPDLSQRLGLDPEAARGYAWGVVFLVRLVWTAGELTTVGLLYLVPFVLSKRKPAPAQSPDRSAIRPTVTSL